MNLTFKKDITDYYNYFVYFNNIEIGKASNTGSEGSKYSIDFKKDIFEISKEYKIKTLFNENIDLIILPVDFEKFPNLNWAVTGYISLWFERENGISLSITPNLVKWNKPFDIIVFLEKLRLSLITHNFLVDFKDNEDFLHDGFTISSDLNLNKNLYEEYEKFLTTINIEIKNIFENTNLIDLSIKSKYSFPSEIRQACEQYLIYFSKFLEDYGIEITSILESKNEETFFSVKPKNSNEALSNIRNLLNFYLSLPDMQNLEIISKDYNDVSVQQLLSNIYHLKSQLFLAHSIIESKNATIESLKFSNFQKQNYIEENLKNEEKALDGLVTIQEFEYASFKLNLPEIFRRLKRKFTK